MFILLAAALLIVTVYVFMLRRQLKAITEQLTACRDGAAMPGNVDISLMDGTVIKLAAAINGCLERERQVRIQASRAERRQKEAIAGISHDFRTPLTSVIGYLQLCRPNEDNLKHVETALKRARELNGLVEQFYELALLDHGDSSPALQRINLSNVLTDFILENTELLEEKSLAPSLLGFEEPVYARADPALLQRIMQNLISNCARHGDGRVIFELKQTEQPVLSVRNKVREPGGLDAGRLFDRFYTGDGGRRGSGIGLAVVRALAEQMGGQAAADLRDGELDISIIFKGDDCRS